MPGRQESNIAGAVSKGLHKLTRWDSICLVNTSLQLSDSYVLKYDHRKKELLLLQRGRVKGSRVFLPEAFRRERLSASEKERGPPEREERTPRAEGKDRRAGFVAEKDARRGDDIKIFYEKYNTISEINGAPKRRTTRPHLFSLLYVHTHRHVSYTGTSTPARDWINALNMPK